MWTILKETCLTAGAAAGAVEARKHVANDPKCVEMGWGLCVPLAVETYGYWGREAQETFSRLATHLATSHRVSKTKAVAGIFGRLNLTFSVLWPRLSWQDAI